MLNLLMWAFWFVLGAFSFWFFAKAKTIQPLTLSDLALVWKFHKQQTGCTASAILTLLTKNDRIVGFKCSCGYEFLQERPITQKIRKSEETITYTSTGEVEQHLQCLGIRCSNITEI